MTDTNQIKAKIAKLLRMQDSDNAGEAANAAVFVERLCREHGFTPNDISSDFDLQSEVAVDFFYGAASRRLDPAMVMIVGAVASYFNGTVVRKHTSKGRRLHVFATDANQLQIEIYVDYLLDVLKQISDRECPKGDRAYRNNFKKGFAVVIYDRLNQMRQERHVNGAPDTNTSALTCRNRDELQNSLALALQDETYPKLRTGASIRMGSHGAGAGQEAARSVGLNHQVKAKKTLALSGSY
jgi:hypothetical protein